MPENDPTTSVSRKSIPTSSGIYQIRNLIDGKKYIGSAVNLRARWISHRNSLIRGDHHSPYLQAAWNKHGASRFAFEVVEAVASKEDLIQREQHYIDKFNTSDNKIGYNISPTAGSSLGTRRTKESRQKQSDIARRRLANPEARAKIVECLADPEVRARISSGVQQHWSDSKARSELAEKAKKRWADPEFREKTIEAMRRAVNPETCTKIAERARQRFADPEVRAEVAERMRQHWADPDARAKRLKQMANPDARARTIAALRQRAFKPRKIVPLPGQGELPFGDPDQD